MLNAEQRLKFKQHHDKNGKGKSGGKRRAAAAVDTNVATDSDDEVLKRKAKKVRCGNYTSSSPYYSWNQARVEEEIRLKREQDAQAQFGRASTSTMKGEKKNDSNV